MAKNLDLDQFWTDFLKPGWQIFSFAQQNYINVVVVCCGGLLSVVPLHFHQKVQLQQSRAVEQL